MIPTIALVTSMIVACMAGPHDVIVKDLKLFVNCEEFIVKAMCYNPVPLGWLTMDGPRTTGGGLCSPKRTPYGETISACFDSDFFDGSTEPDRVPPGPQDGWFKGLWDRDFPAIKELGANTLRLYNANPTTRKASIEQLGTNFIVEPLGKDHVPFMDMAEQWGFKVIFPLMGDYTLLHNNPPETVQRLLRNQIDEVGNHSALLMWNFSNEWPLSEFPQDVDMLNGYIDYIRNYTLVKWDRSIPITVAIVDNPFSYNSLVTKLNVDVFSSNAGYRGTSFTNLWSGMPPDFLGFEALSKQTGKPLFISEFGWHTLNNEITYQIPNWVNQGYKDFVLHIDMGTVGFAFFEWSDEPNKDDPLQKTMGVVNYTLTTVDGVSSNQLNMFIPDTLVRKDIIYEAMKAGMVDGVPYNFNADIWELLGREPTVLSLEECVPVILPPSFITTAAITTGTTGVVTTGELSTTGTIQNPSTSTTGIQDSTTGPHQVTTTGNQQPVSTTGSTNTTAIIDPRTTENSAVSMAISFLVVACLTIIWI